MQHYGVPTRLLDWTESLDIALYFALLGRSPKPSIWVLNPFRLNEASMGKNVIFDEVDALGFDYDDTLKNDFDFPFGSAVAISPPWSEGNNRIVSQNGYFTFHNSAACLSGFHSRICKQIVLSDELVRNVRKHLRNQLDHFRVFPDLDGLAEAIKVKFSLKDMVKIHS